MRERHVMPFVVMFVLFLIVGSLLAHAQIGGSSVQPLTQPSYSVPDHPMHAAQGTLRSETSLLGSGGVTYAQGERPLWEFGSGPAPIPLGDSARRYREEHAKLPKDEKAQIVWNQQGQ